MLFSRPVGSTLPRIFAFALVATAVEVGAPAPASAHFILENPPSSTAQNGIGDPQKAPPCGDDGSATPSNTVTAFQAGQTITVTIDEKIFHPGHYRISLGVNGPDDLPVEPIVTPGSNTPCGTAPIEATPTFPVLADGVFAHQAPFSGPQSITITLPANVTCEHCTLQVIEFMSDHPLNNPGGCYYHHCADISIEASTNPDASTSSSSGTGSASDSSASASAGTGGASGATSGTGGTGAASGTTDEESGCRFTGAASRSNPVVTGLAGIAALAALALRRRRR
jgi:MYXO-CTERM domain-containing protein